MSEKQSIFNENRQQNKTQNKKKRTQKNKKKNKECIMPKPRKQQISLAVTPYYHCMSRCVRRAHLCGKDELTGRSFEHRRAWIESRALAIAQVFAIDIVSYAIMSNHYHVVLFVDKEKAKSWSHDEVLQQWYKLFKGNALLKKYINQEVLNPKEQKSLIGYAKKYRKRLKSISWFMRSLNEYIARKSNEEDKCTGRFWESRFKSQALLDESALLSCAVYVDLNPIRSGIATTPEKSDYTSIKQRCNTAQKSRNPNHINAQHKGLHPFIGNQQVESKESNKKSESNESNKNRLLTKGMPLSLTAYLELVEWTGQIQRPDKKGVIPKQEHSILTRLGMNQQQWLNISQRFEQSFKQFAGKEASLRKAAKVLNYRRPSGISLCRQNIG